jgi:rhodanese-related sulfurtransferase
MSQQVPEVGVLEVKQMLGGTNPPKLIDVRETDEWAICSIDGAELLPLSKWPNLAQEKLIDPEQALIIHCHHGGRSARATAWLIQQGFKNVKNMAGGIDAWSVEVDATVPRYE